MMPRDMFSFNLGMVNAFCEMVEQGVKRLALSPPIDNGIITEFFAATQEIAAKFNVRCYQEPDFIETHLATKADLSQKTVILLYQDDLVLQEYLDLKTANGDIAQATQSLRKLLGYPD